MARANKKGNSVLIRKLIDFDHPDSLFDGPYLRRRCAGDEGNIWIAVGEAAGQMIVLRYSADEDGAQLIKARRATVHEQENYYSHHVRKPPPR